VKATAARSQAKQHAPSAISGTPILSNSSLKGMHSVLAAPESARSSASPAASPAAAEAAAAAAKLAASDRFFTSSSHSTVVHQGATAMPLASKIGTSLHWQEGRFCHLPHGYSRSPRNPALQQLQKSVQSASMTPQRPIWNYFAIVAVRDFRENGCSKIFPHEQSTMDSIIFPTVGPYGPLPSQLHVHVHTSLINTSVLVVVSHDMAAWSTPIVCRSNLELSHFVGHSLRGNVDSLARRPPTRRSPLQPVLSAPLDIERWRMR